MAGDNEPSERFLTEIRRGTFGFIFQQQHSQGTDDRGERGAACLSHGRGFWNLEEGR